MEIHSLGAISTVIVADPSQLYLVMFFMCSIHSVYKFGSIRARRALFASIMHSQASCNKMEHWVTPKNLYQQSYAKTKSIEG